MFVLQNKLQCFVATCSKQYTQVCRSRWSFAISCSWLTGVRIQFRKHLLFVSVNSEDPELPSVRPCCCCSVHCTVLHFASISHLAVAVASRQSSVKSNKSSGRRSGGLSRRSTRSRRPTPINSPARALDRVSKTTEVSRRTTPLGSPARGLDVLSVGRKSRRLTPQNSDRSLSISVAHSDSDSDSENVSGSFSRSFKYVRFVAWQCFGPTTCAYTFVWSSGDCPSQRLGN